MKYSYILLFSLSFLASKAQVTIDNVFQKQSINSISSNEVQDNISSLISSQLLTLSESKGEEIFNTQGSFSLQIPLKSGFVEVQLTPANIFSPDFKVMTPNGKAIVELPHYYHGKIKGDEKSFVALTITENSVEGLIMNDKINLTIGRVKDTQEVLHIIYNTSELPNTTPICNNPVELEFEGDLPEIQQNQTNTTECTAVEIYLEADYQMFLDWGSSEQTVTQRMTAIFNNVSLLYHNEGINLVMSELFIWDVPDPYESATNTTQGLNQLTDYWNHKGNDFNGDIVHLVSTKSLGGGRAYYLSGSSVFNGMTQRAVFNSCDKKLAKGISGGITNTVNNIPTYSWNVLVIAHELGHNFGLPHTHSCTWSDGVNRGPLDNCAFPQDGFCFRGPAPVNGGTIMSYCHDDPDVRTNFNNGFHSLVSAKMNAEFNAATCLSGSKIPAPLVSNRNVNNNESVVLSASGCTGSYRWYNSSVNGSLISTTSTYTTPPMFITTSYFVSCTVGSCTSRRAKVDVIIRQNPENDNCSNSTQLTSNLIAKTGTLYGATTDGIVNPNCDQGTSPAKGVFYKFTAQAVSHQVIFNPTSGSDIDAVLSAYSGSSCFTLNEIACTSTGTQGAPVTLNLNTLNIGQTYWIRVHDYAPTPFTLGNFSIGVTHNSGTVCSSDAYENNNTFQTAYNFGSQSVSISSLCLTSGDIDWFKFNGADGNIYYAKINGSNNAQGPYGLDIQGSSTQIILETKPSGGQSIDTYLSLYDENQTLLNVNDNGGSGALSKIVYTFPSSAPGNDYCNNATDLISSTSCNYVSGTVKSATYDDVAKPNCDYHFNPDQKGVWYKFIAQSSSHQIKVVPNSSGSSGMDVVIALYSGGNCYNLIERGCEDTPGGNGVTTTLNASNLTVGNVYWILVYDYGNSQPADPKFSICVTHGSTSNPSNLQLHYPATQTIVSIPVNFSWSASNATSYQLQIVNGSDLVSFNGADGINGSSCTNCILNTVIHGTSFTWTGAEPGNNAYAWAVRALNSSGSTQYQARTFGTINASSNPDILISSIWTEPEKVYTNTDIDLYMSMKNVGNSTASSIDINYYLDGALIDDDYHSSLSSGETREEYENNYVFTSPGIYEYCVEVESVSGESNLSNNYTCIDLEVIQAYGDIFVTNAQLDENVVFQGSQISLSATHNYTGNQTTSELPNFDLDYYLSTDCEISADDIVIGLESSSLGSNDPSENESQVFNLGNSILPGQYYVIFSADNDNELIETDETNNKVCIPIEIKRLTSCNSSDFAFLKEIYTKTNGDNWLNNTGWEIIKNNSSPPVGCSFENLYGINASEVNEVSRVNEVFLQNNNLTGTLPIANSSLSSLVTLDLSSNDISGTINSSFGLFPQLWQLNLGQNNLTGSFASELINNTSLTYLNVSKNNLNGTLPSTISNLNNLVFLYLHGNNFSGKLPKELGDLSNVEYMGIRDNAFSDCYDANLNKLCPKISNTYLMDNNGNTTSWVNFCLNNSGICVSCLETLGHSSTAFDFNSGTNNFETNSINGTVNLSNKILGTAKINYKAGRYILLEPGFKVDQGAVFSAEHGGCTND